MLHDFRIEMVVPSLPTLLAYASRQKRGDIVPALSSMLNHIVIELLIFLIRPRSFRPTLGHICLLKTQVHELLGFILIHITGLVFFGFLFDMLNVLKIKLKFKNLLLVVRLSVGSLLEFESCIFRNFGLRIV
jgi:hypothetical protein